MWELVNQLKWIVMNHGPYPVWLKRQSPGSTQCGKSSCPKLCETTVLDGLDESPGRIALQALLENGDHIRTFLFCIDCWCSSKSLLHLASVMLYLYTKMHPRFTVSTHSSNVSQVTIRLSTKDHPALWPSDSPAFYILSACWWTNLSEGRHMLVAVSSLVLLTVIMMSEFSTTKEPWSWINASTSGLYVH